MQRTVKTIAQKAVCGISALALVAGMSAFPLAGSAGQAAAAQADDSVLAAAAVKVQAASADGLVIAASYRAAEPAPEILGLTNVGTNTAWQSVGELNWGAPYYYLFGTSDYNSNPNPYMVNAVYNNTNKLSADDSGYATPTMIYYQRQGGPTAAMYSFGSTDKTGSDDVWKTLPDVILGTGNGVDYSNADYAPAVAAAVGVSSYEPIGVKYDSTNIYTMIDSMYNLADAADTAAADSDKKLRYGDASDIAAEYEQYVRGTLGYVLYKLDVNKAEKKTVALVNNYDATSGTYTLVKTGVEEGTAASNRYLEAVQPVAVNLADSMEGDAPTVTASELAQVDLILLGSQAGSESIASTDDILNSFTADMQAKTFWVNSDNGSAGSTYGVVMNSVENAQNIGRILGCLYSEYVDQDDWICYYYDHFYHLNTGKLAEAIDNAMDGVRNWDAATGSSYSSLTQWSTADAATYNSADVAAKLEIGTNYLLNNKTATSSFSLLQPTDAIENTATVTSDKLTATVDTASKKYTGAAIEPAVSDVKLGSKALAAGEYDVAYVNNVNAGTATIVVTAPNYVDASGNMITLSETFKITGVTPTLTMTKTTSVAMGKTLNLNVKTNSTATPTYSSSNAKIAKVSKNGVVTPVKKGTAKITVALKADGNYTKASKAVTITVKQGSQSLTFANQSVKASLAKVKNAAQTVAITKAKNAKTAVTYSIAKYGNAKAKKYITGINKSSGKLTVAKGTPKGTYKVTVKATAAANSNWAKATKNSVVTIKVS